MVKEDHFTHKDLFPKISFGNKFKKAFKRFKDKSFRDKIKNRARELIYKHGKGERKGKHMRNIRKGTLEVKIDSYRLSFIYLEEEDELVFLDLYHKDDQ
jgi:mRNA-degrading endonuclease RelE of RelBE toxin-antitoxin system